MYTRRYTVKCHVLAAYRCIDFTSSFQCSKQWLERSQGTDFAWNTKEKNTSCCFMSTSDTKSYNTFNDCRTCMKLDKDLRSTLAATLVRAQVQRGMSVGRIGNWSHKSSHDVGREFFRLFLRIRQNEVNVVLTVV